MSRCCCCLRRRQASHDHPAASSIISLQDPAAPLVASEVDRSLFGAHQQPIDPFGPSSVAQSQSVQGPALTSEDTGEEQGERPSEASASRQPHVEANSCAHSYAPGAMQCYKCGQARSTSADDVHTEAGNLRTRLESSEDCCIACGTDFAHGASNCRKCGVPRPSPEELARAAAAKDPSLDSTDLASTAQSESTDGESADVVSTPQAQAADMPGEGTRDQKIFAAALQGQSEIEQAILKPLVLLMLQDEGWEIHSKGEAEVAKQSRVGGFPGHERQLMMWRIRKLLKNATPRAVFEILMDTERQQTWHTYVTGGKNHGKAYGPTLLQTWFSGAWPVAAPREAVEFRAASLCLDDPMLWIAYSSFNTEQANLPLKAKHERTYTNCSGYCLEAGPEPGSVWFNFFSHNDTGGGIPDIFIRTAGPKVSLEFVSDLEAAIKRFSQP